MNTNHFYCFIYINSLNSLQNPRMSVLVISHLNEKIDIQKKVSNLPKATYL